MTPRFSIPKASCSTRCSSNVWDSKIICQSFRHSSSSYSSASARTPSNLCSVSSSLFVARRIPPTWAPVQVSLPGSAWKSGLRSEHTSPSSPDLAVDSDPSLTDLCRIRKTSYQSTKISKPAANMRGLSRTVSRIRSRAACMCLLPSMRPNCKRCSPGCTARRVWVCQLYDCQC